MRKFLPILKILLYNPKIQINRHFMEHIRPPKFASSFVSAGAHINHMASYCPCVFGVHRNLPRTRLMHSGNDNRWYAHLYVIVSSIANQLRMNGQICNYMLTSYYRRMSVLHALSYQTLREVELKENILATC